MDSFIVHVKPEDISTNLAGDVKKRFDTSNSKAKKLLLIGKNIEEDQVKDELGRKISKEFVALGPEMYSYLTHNDNVDKKAKTTKKCIIRQKIIFQDCKECWRIIKQY